MAHIRPGCAQDPLELHAGDHIGRFSIGEYFLNSGIEQLVSYCKDHSSHFKLCPLRPVIIINRPGKTDLFTEPASDALLPIYGVSQRDCLGVLDGRSGPDIQTAVEFIHTVYRTGLAALPAPGAYIRVYIPGMINERDIEMPGLTIKGFNL
jgi:hypothetical protein